MVDTAREAGRVSLRRDAVLEAVAFAAERLLRTPDWRDVIGDVLAHLGEAADVSRAYVVANETSDPGDITATWVEEWTSGNTVRVSEDPTYGTASWRGGGFGRWADVLAQGGSLVGDLEDFPSGERDILARHGVRSLASFPLTIEGEWWGTVGFDDCVRARDWTGPEAEVLRTAATLIGAAIERQRQEARLRATEARYRSVVERIPAVTYFDLVSETAVELGSVSPQRAPVGTATSRSTRSIGCAEPTVHGSGCMTRRHRCETSAARSRSSRGSCSM